MNRVKADWLDDGSYAEPMNGCSIVFHTASPFSTNVDDPQKELVDTALFGTWNVLQEANLHGRVRLVVPTSRRAAIYGDNADVQKAPGGILTEDIWNTSSSLTHQPYSCSKTVAEQEAWWIVEQQSHGDLITINPSRAIGRGINPHAISESFSLVKKSVSTR